MSLVFLKNDTNNINVAANDHMKPYDWANYFDTPLVLPPDSQVAYISSTMTRDKVIDFPAPQNVLWMQTGNEQLNIPMPIILDTTQGAETWGEVMSQITANKFTGNTDFMYDGLSGGLTATFDDATQKIKIQMTQRLQPPVQDVWANRGQAISAAWGGLNDTGMGAASGSNGGTATTSLLAGGASTLWDCGWTRCDLAAGGFPPGNPAEFVNNNHTCFYTTTGIKGAVDNIALTGLGGEVHFKGGIIAGAQSATATAQSIPYIAGLNSVQAIESVPATGGNTSIQNYVDECVINGTGIDTALTPNVVQIRIQDQKVYVEVMQTHLPVNPPAPGGPLQRGSWGNCESEQPPPAGTAPYGMKIMDEIDIDTWLTTPLTQPQNTGGEASQPYFNQNQPTNPANNFNQIVFKIKWKTPNTFQIYMGTGYEERSGKYAGTTIAGGNQYAPGTAYQDTYSIIYDSEDGGTYSNNLAGDVDKTFFVPTFFGDLGFCGWIDRRTRLDFRGNFDVIKCYGDNVGTPYPSYDQMLRGIDGINFSSNPPTSAGGGQFPNTYHLQAYQDQFIYPPLGGNEPEDEWEDGAVLATNAGYNSAKLRLVVGPTDSEGPPSIYQRWYPQPINNGSVNKIWYGIPNQPDTNIGVVMGLIKNTDDGSIGPTLPTPNDVRFQVWNGAEMVGETEIYNSVHIQLTNLPINGRNGVTSTKTATIAVVHNAIDDGMIDRSSKLYNHYTPEKNWIDLNNISEMTLNELRVYISNDSNQPASYLTNKSDVVVCFRKRPDSDGGISRQVITNGGMYNSNGQTNR